MITKGQGIRLKRREELKRLAKELGKAQKRTVTISELVNRAVDLFLGEGK